MTSSKLNESCIGNRLFTETRISITIVSTLKSKQFEKGGKIYGKTGTAALNANSSKTVKATNFRDSSDMTP